MVGEWRDWGGVAGVGWVGGGDEGGVLVEISSAAGGVVERREVWLVEARETEVWGLDCWWCWIEGEGAPEGRWVSSS